MYRRTLLSEPPILIKHHGWMATTMAEVAEFCILGSRTPLDLVLGRGINRLRIRLKAPMFSLPREPKLTSLRFFGFTGSETKLSLPEARIAVISPHMDDAVLSLGATINAAAALGTHVEVVTVFAGDPASDRPPGPWDRRCGFVSEGDAVRGRRHEDGVACSLIGATPKWLPFGDKQYMHFGCRTTVVDTVATAVRDFDVLLMPGFPLMNPDHAWLSRELLSRPWPGKRIGLYAEQPYCYFLRRKFPVLDLADALRGILMKGRPNWFRLTIPVDHRVAKNQAVVAYRSQLRCLGLGRFSLARLLRHEASQGGEAIAWIA